MGPRTSTLCPPMAQASYREAWTAGGTDLSRTSATSVSYRRAQEGQRDRSSSLELRRPHLTQMDLVWNRTSLSSGQTTDQDSSFRSCWSTGIARWPSGLFGAAFAVWAGRRWDSSLAMGAVSMGSLYSLGPLLSLSHTPRMHHGGHRWRPQEKHLEAFRIASYDSCGTTIVRHHSPRGRIISAVAGKR